MLRRLALLSILCAACAQESTRPSTDANAPPASPDEDAGTASLTCPVVASASSPGKVRHADVQEVSGIAASTKNPGVFWVHNDSGDTARVFALGPNGDLLATLTFDDRAPTDIEDLAIEDAEGGESYLYLADIGDNDAVRTTLTIHRIAEPKLDGTATLDVPSQKMRVRYSDGAHDAETLLFDPATRELFIATKGGSSTIHRVGVFAPDTTATTTPIAELPIPLATGGAISRDGRGIALRNYTTTARLWLRAPGESLGDALARDFCSLSVAEEKQGESFAFLADDRGFVTLSEGTGQALQVSLFE